VIDAAIAKPETPTVALGSCWRAFRVVKSRIRFRTGFREFKHLMVPVGLRGKFQNLSR
jgi:hypothetical protein